MCRKVLGILRKTAWVAAALTFALSSASPSKAGTLTVDFDLSGSTLMLGDLINASNGMGATVTGMTRLVLTGVDSMGMVTGSMASATLQGLGLTINLNAPLVAGASLVGPISITQMGMATGGFDGATASLAQGSFVTNLSTNLDCVGMQCALISQLGMITFPIVQNSMISNDTGVFPVMLAGLNGSAAMLSAMVNTMNAGQSVTLAFRGAEIAGSRMFVGDAMMPPMMMPPQMPEPVESGLLILGVLALCGVAAVRRQQAV
jgi:hypothetical protein